MGGCSPVVRHRGPSLCRGHVQAQSSAANLYPGAICEGARQFERHERNLEYQPTSNSHHYKHVQTDDKHTLYVNVCNTNYIQ